MAPWLEHRPASPRLWVRPLVVEEWNTELVVFSRPLSSSLPISLSPKASKGKKKTAACVDHVVLPSPPHSQRRGRRPAGWHGRDQRALGPELGPESAGNGAGPCELVPPALSQFCSREVRAAPPRPSLQVPPSPDQ